MAEPLGIAGTLEVLARLGALADEIVLIGGQALNFWAEHYKDRPALRALQGGIASKDIDFCGTQQHVQRCALALEGRAQYQTVDARSRCVGIVHYVDAQRDERAIDILSTPYGLQGERLWEHSVPATLTARDGRSARVRVMHRLHCLISRAANVADLPAYQSERGVRQLLAAIVCMHIYLEDQLDRGEVKAATRQSEALFTFCLKSSYAHTLRTRDGIEAFDAMVGDHERLPESSGPSATRRCARTLRTAARRRARSRRATAPNTKSSSWGCATKRLFFDCGLRTARRARSRFRAGSALPEAVAWNSTSTVPYVFCRARGDEGWSGADATAARNTRATRAMGKLND
jgi:hypothetical protein